MAETPEADQAVTHVAVISANLGGYDQPNQWPELLVPPGVSLSVVRLTDATFPPRPLAMTSRLQCGIPKWFGHDFAPEADAIIWIDASCAPTPVAVEWWLAALGDGDIAVFRHPDRRTVREEYEFMKARMARPGERYLTSRYAGEDLDGQYEAVVRLGWQDEPLLYASTAFAYRRGRHVCQALAEVFAQKARFCLHDQLAFGPTLERYRLNRTPIDVRVIEQNYLRCPALTYTRNQRRTQARGPRVPIRSAPVTSALQDYGEQ